MTPKLIHANARLVPDTTRSTTDHALSKAMHEPSGQHVRVVMQVALTIEIPAKDIESFRTSGVVTIGMGRD